MNKKYLKVMFGTKSGADSNLEYKLDEINIAQIWKPNETNVKKMGGFNFSVENKIFRWLVRGDTIYEVTIPIDADIIDCSTESCPQGVFRSNKIILTNPIKVTDELAMELYNKSVLPEKSYFKAMAGCAVRGYMKTANKVLKEKVNRNNIELAILEYEDFIKPEKEERFDISFLDNNTKEIYNKLLSIKNMMR